MPSIRHTTTLVSAAALAAALTVSAFASAQGGGTGQAQGGQAGGRGRGGGAARDALTQPVGQGAISGVVVSDSGAPVRRARVSLSGAELRGARSALTNDQGAYEFAALPAGRFTMTASKAGYVNNAYGAKRPGRPGTPIQLGDGQKIENATISLPKGSVVTGIVLDDNGEPSPGTTVRVMRYVLRAGEKALVQAGTDTTDDRGMYRIYALQPGDYMVSATPRNQTLGALRETVAAELEALLQQAQAAGGAGGGRAAGGGRGAALGGALPIGGARGGAAQALADRAAALQEQLALTEQDQSAAYAPVYYPGTTSPSGAQTVTLGIGDERGGVDFHLQLVPTARVTGIVTSQAGALPQGTQVMLVSADRAGLPAIPGVGNNNARVGPDGRFTFQNVTPGQYHVQARAAVREVDPNAAETEVQAGGRGGRGGPGGRGGAPVTQVLWASADLTIAGGNPPDVVLNLQPGMTVTGRVEFQGAQGDPSRVRVNLVPRGQQVMEMGFAGVSEVDATGRFTIKGVAPGRYSINANANAGGGRGGGAGAAAPAATWTLQSAVVNGVEALDFPFEVGPNQDIGGAVITFGTTTQELSGTLQDATGRPTADYTIVLFAADNRFWTPQSRRISAARPDTNGRFTLRGLPPGEYRLTAIVDAEPGEWYDPAFLAQLVGASIPVALSEGEKKVQDIRVAGGS